MPAILKVCLGVYFGGLVISAVAAFIADPSGTVGPWLIIAWAVFWGPVATVALAVLLLVLRALAKLGGSEASKSTHD